jgi:hypothetical protein
VDWSLGRVLDFLKKTDDPRHPGKKLIETTYIIFSSDNGGAEQHKKEVISDNYPLKYGKTYVDEGGVRVPMVVAGPGVPSGRQFDGLVSQLDYFPTILKLTGAEIAPGHKKELSGLDISPVLAGRSQKVVDAGGTERKSLFWHFPHGRPSNMKAAIREGDFKLYKKYTDGGVELYRLYRNGKRADIEEKRDLANQPEYGPVVERLSAHLEADLKANNAKGPYLNPASSNKSLPAAEISSVDFAPATRKATLTLAKGSTGIREAPIIYRSVAAGTHKPGAVESGVRFPASISEDGRVVTADVPAEVAVFCFLIIDENNYQIASTFDVEGPGKLLPKSALEKNMEQNNGAGQ